MPFGYKYKLVLSNDTQLKRRIKMIKKSSNIDERKLVKVIKEGYSYVNIQDNGFQYSEGHIVVNCTYENDLVIQKLFSIGAIKDYRNWTPTKSYDFSKILKIDKEIKAEKTKYLYQMPSGELTIFKTDDGKYHYVQKQYVDIFKDVDYSATSDNTEFPLLIARNYKKELIGVILPVRIAKEEDNILKIINARG